MEEELEIEQIIESNQQILQNYELQFDRLLNYNDANEREQIINEIIEMFDEEIEGEETNNSIISKIHSCIIQPILKATRSLIIYDQSSSFSLQSDVINYPRWFKLLKQAYKLVNYFEIITTISNPNELIPLIEINQLMMDLSPPYTIQDIEKNKIIYMDLFFRRKFKKLKLRHDVCNHSNPLFTNVYREHYIDENQKSGYWILIDTLENFIPTLLDPIINKTAYLQYIENPKMIENIIHGILAVPTDDFPILIQRRELISFRDGIYNIYEDTFIEYYPNINMITSKFIDKEFKPTYNSILEDNIFICPDNIDKFKAQGLRYFNYPQWDDNLPTPLFDKITETQQFTKDTRFWLFFFLGRLLFRIGIDDNYQIGIMFRGMARSGKSLIIDIIKEFFPREKICNLESRREDVFGHQRLINCWIWIIGELEISTNQDWGFWKKLVEYNDLTIARKNTQTWEGKINAHGITATNSSYLGDNDQGSRARRQATFGFYFRPDNVDADLFTKIKSNEIHHILRKCVMHYIYGRDIIQKIYNGDIWMAMPESIWIERRKTEMSSHSLYKFLISEPDIRYGPECFVNFSEFKKRFEFYIKEQSLQTGKRRNIDWTTQYFAPVFQALNIKLSKKLFPIPNITNIHPKNRQYNDPIIYNEIDFDETIYHIEEVLIGISLDGKDPQRIIPCFLSRHLSHSNSEILLFTEIHNAIYHYHTTKYPNETDYRWKENYFIECLDILGFIYNIEDKYVLATFNLI